MTSPQEADPKLDGLRAEYDRHSDDWRRNGKAVRYELAEAAWRETVAYIERRERARWEAAVRAQVDEDVRALVIVAERIANYYVEDIREHTFGDTVDDLRAALEPFKAVAPTADVEEVERGN